MNKIHGQLLNNSKFCQCIKIMVAERKRVSRLNLRISTPEGVPLPSNRNKRGTNESTSKKQVFSMHLGSGLLKPTGNVGQPAKNNRDF